MASSEKQPSPAAFALRTWIEPMKTLTSSPASDSAQRLDQSLLPFPSYLEDDREHGLSADQATAAAFYHPPSQPAPPLSTPCPVNTSPDPVIPMATKVCVKCKQEKPLLEFHKNSRSADGLHSYCKECNRAQALAHIRAEKARKALLRAAKKAAGKPQ
jgi:hypothetical protein